MNSRIQEIDGLRAIAVVLVVLFHLDISLFSGGFVGVDVFLVISGYLITDVLTKQTLKNDFCISNFYLNRWVRLYPALLATILVSMMVGFLIMAPGHFKDLSRQSLYALFGLSNISHWRDSGYFDSSVNLKPLLHTWSLSLEMQFYLLWPLLFLGMKKVIKNHSFIVYGAISLFSLAFSQYFLKVDQSGAYFLLPFRLFEFGMGALTLHLVKNLRLKNFIQETGFIVGLVLILASAVIYDKHTAFPGLHAVIPTLGASLCILCRQARLMGKILRINFIQTIGLISYSIYLVHWPLIIFYKYYSYHSLEFLDQTLLIVATLGLSYWLHKNIENYLVIKKSVQPIQRKRLWFALGAFVICGIFAIFVYRQNGMNFRVPEKSVALLKGASEYHLHQYGGYGYELTTKLGSPRSSLGGVIAGDSFALQYAAGLDEVLKEKNYQILGIFQHGCFLAVDVTVVYNNKPREACLEKIQELMASLKENRLPLILSFSWTGYYDLLVTSKGQKVSFKNTEDYMNFIINKVDELHKLTGSDRKIYILGNPPGGGQFGDVVSCLLRPSYLPHHCMQNLKFNALNGNGREANQHLRNYAAKTSNVTFIDPYQVFCHNDECDALGEGSIRYSDGSHLSIDGSKEFARYFSELWSEIL